MEVRERRNKLNRMRSHEVQKLIEAVEAVYGPVKLYGSEPSEEYGTCFKVAGVPATFSVLTLEGTLPSGRYDVQIESSPQGDYLYSSEVSLAEFLNLIAQINGPVERWPTMNEEPS